MAFSPLFGWGRRLRAALAPRVIGSNAPDAIGLGRYRDEATGEIGPRIRYGGQTGIVLIGRNGGGKDTRICVPLLLNTEKVSIFAIDPKGEMSAICGPWRRQLAQKEGGRYVSINPYQLHADTPGYKDLASDGFDPLIGLDPADDNFSVSCSYIAEAIIEGAKNDSGNAKHFIESAKAMLHAAIMWEVICAHREGRRATFANVRKMICTPSFEKNGVAYGWPTLAREMIGHGNPVLANLASQFVAWNNEVSGVASDAKRQTMMFDDNPIARDMLRGTFDFAEMKRRPCTVMLMLPPMEMKRQAPYLRMVVDSALRATMRPRAAGEPKCLYLLNEFATLGRLEILSQVWGAVRGYGIQLMPILQSYSQLTALYGDKDAETFVEQAGVLASFGAVNMPTAEFLSKRCGEVTTVVRSASNNRSFGPGGMNLNSGTSANLVKRPRVTPMDALDMRDGEMLQFVAGRAKYVPAFAPSYWDIAQCAARARPNPFHLPQPPAPAVATRVFRPWRLGKVRRLALPSLRPGKRVLAAILTRFV